MNILSMQNLLARNTAQSLSGYQIKKLDDALAEKLFDNPNHTLALKSNLNVIRCLQNTINDIEATVLRQIRFRPEFKQLLTVSGIGKILGLTIMLESGDMCRFLKVGNYSSYCRCVKSERFSNGKKKGEGNRKNGNKYLAWAFIEAANFAIRYNDKVKAF